MHRKTRPYLFYSTTSGLCGQCAQRVEAKIIIKQQNVYMDKWCPQHGTERVLISTDADYYRRCREVFIKPPELPQFNLIPRCATAALGLWPLPRPHAAQLFKYCGNYRPL